jgi:hypothetical protein
MSHNLVITCHGDRIPEHFNFPSQLSQQWGQVKAKVIGAGSGAGRRDPRMEQMPLEADFVS